MRFALGALRRAGGSKPGLLGSDFLLGGLVFGYFPAGHRVLPILKKDLLVLVLDLVQKIFLKNIKSML